MTAFYFSDFHV